MADDQFVIREFVTALPPFDVRITQLLDHVASKAKNEWVVTEWAHTAAGASWHFDNYEDASAKFDALSDEGHPTLILYTRLGTAVQFRYKGAPQE